MVAMTGKDGGCKPRPGKVRTLRVLGTDAPVLPGTIGDALLRALRGERT